MEKEHKIVYFKTIYIACVAILISFYADLKFYQGWCIRINHLRFSFISSWSKQFKDDDYNSTEKF